MNATNILLGALVVSATGGSGYLLSEHGKNQLNPVVVEAMKNHQPEDGKTLSQNGE
jgi:hypothetical protein